MYKSGTSERADLPLAVVVGAGGLGMAVARRMALSFRVLLADVDATKAENEAARLREEGCDAVAAHCDITARESVAELAQNLADRGGFGALVQVAGVSPATAGSLADILRINLVGAVNVAEALRPIARQGSAAILVSSLSAHRYRPPEQIAALLREPTAPDLIERIEQALGDDAANKGLGYPISKWGMNLYCRRQTVAWGALGARIVSISPGMIATPMGAREMARSENKRAMFAKSPLKRECTMLEIADAIEFLASPRASFISGTDLLVDGGLTAALLDA